MTRLKHLFSALGLVVVSGGLARAAGGHGGFTFALEGWYIVDFVILVALLWFLLKGPAKRFLEGRHDRIKAELEAATRLRQEAEARLAEVETLVKGIEAEIAVVREQFRQDGVREATRIMKETEATVERTEAGLKKQREQELAKLRETLSAELVASVLGAAESKLKKKLDAKTQARVTGDFIDALEKLPSLNEINGVGRAA